MRSIPSIRRPNQSRRPRYRPHLLPLEDRLPLGDAVLGLLVGASLLGPRPAPLAAVHASACQPGVFSIVGRISNPSAWLDGLEIRPTEAFADDPRATRAAPMEDVLHDVFARPAASSRAPARAEPATPSPIMWTWAAAPIHAGGATAAAPVAPGTARPADGDLLVILAALQTPAPPDPGGEVTPAQEAQVQESFGKLPLSFEQNVGQSDAQVHFFTRGPGYGLFLTGTEAVMVLNSAGRAGGVNPPVPNHIDASTMHREVDTPRSPEAPPAVVRMQLVGANAAPTVTGSDELPGTVNYFLGNDPAKWRTNVSTFARVEYDEVYPGIDLVWHGSQNQPEYDFVVAPGADPSAIRLGFSGAERVELNAAGDLVLHAGGQEFRQQAPLVYQEAGGQQQEVASRFVLDGPQVTFAVGAYDAGRPLVIDPVLSFSTHLGGNGWDDAYDSALDPSTGDILVIGSTESTNFPTASPFQSTNRGGSDAFVTRMRADGTALIYSTYLGGSGSDLGYGLAVDAAGNAYLSGETTSLNFPTANPFQPTNRGGSDAFVTQLSADGAALVYSTYLGGSGDDRASRKVALDAAGNAYVAGATSSTNFPTANALQPTLRGVQDAFVTQLSAGGTALVYSTYLGGSGRESADGVAVDPAGNAYVAGQTESSDFPTRNAVQPTFGGVADAFIAELKPSGAALVYSTYLGGNSFDYGGAIAVDAAGSAYAAGETWSRNFPTVSAFQPGFGGGNADGFVARLSVGGAALVYSTYLGGNSWDFGVGIALDGAGNVYVAGLTESPNFPTANPVQPTHGGGYDGFVTQLTADGAALVYSTFLGGSAHDYANGGVAVDAAGNLYVAGTTRSSNFPTVNALQPTHGGGFADAFVAKLSEPPTLFGPAIHYNAGPGPNAVLTADFTGDGIADLVTANGTGNNISLLRGAGDGTFYPPLYFGVGATTEPRALVAGDFNGDGRLDLAVANFGRGVSILLGRRFGIFRPAVTYNAGPGPSALATADFTGDGVLDLAVTNYGSNQVRVLLGDGAGGFKLLPGTRVGTGPVSVAAGDFNNDGLADLVVANRLSNNVSTLLGNGDGSFQPAVTIATGAAPVHVAVADFDFDELLDLVVVSSGANRVSVLMGNGDGTFRPGASYTTGTNPSHVALADLDYDGLLDLVVANAGSNHVSAFLGHGDGNFDAAGSYATDAQPAGVVVEDFDGDGLPDLAVANRGSANVSVLINVSGP